jgi:redox-sensitive bicupin YhaK (pirin superfamily)
MKTDAVFTRSDRAEKISRQIALRTRGHSHGGLTRLVSPGDVGERIKPFAFLDYFDADLAAAPKFGFHPVRGATLTSSWPGRLLQETPAAKRHRTGGVEWMRASGGVWHAGGILARSGSGLSALVAMPRTQTCRAEASISVRPTFILSAPRGLSPANTTV